MPVRRLVFLFVALFAAAAQAGPFVAKQLSDTSEDRALLFGGTDPAGGVGDWYMSNGEIEAVIDDVGFQDGLPAGVLVQKQNSVAPSGGYLVDLGRVGRDNDQLSQAIMVVGTEQNQLPVYTSIAASVEAEAAVITATGTVPFDSDTGGAPFFQAVTVPIVTEFRAEKDRKALTMRTTLTNDSTGPILVLNLFDAFVWTMKGPLPFTPMPGRGFNHHALPIPFAQAALVSALEFAPYVVAAGTVDERDGWIDETTKKPVGGTCYGIVSAGATVDPDGAGGPLPAVPAIGLPILAGVNSITASAIGFGGPNALAPGASFTYTRHVFVGTRSDVSGCTDLVFPHLGIPTFEAHGQVLDEDGKPVDASVLVSLAGPPPISSLQRGAPLTQVRTDTATGGFDLELPPGTYNVRATASERPPVEGTLLVAPNGAVELSPLTMAKVASIDVAASVENEPGAPLRVSFVPADETTETPRIGKLFDVITFDSSHPGSECGPGSNCIPVCSLDPERRCTTDFDCLPGQCVAGVDERPESFGGGVLTVGTDQKPTSLAQGNTLYTRSGSGRVELRPGKYHVVASRGLEYTIDDGGAPVDAAAGGEAVQVVRSIARAVETPEALSADFHIHSARSFDSSAPLFGRVLSFAAENLEVMVSSEHDFHLDYSPVIDEMLLGPWITSIAGNEVTTGSPPTVGNELKFGHLNGFPVPLLPGTRRRGAIEDEFVSPNVIYERLRGQGAQVIQINHPRAPAQQGNTGIGWFNNAHFDPNQPIDQDPNNPNAFLLDDCVVPAAPCPAAIATRNIDFDTLEVANAARSADFLAYRLVRRDWFWLLLQGYVKPATGVSDSHRLTVETPGYARTLVLGVGDEPSGLAPVEFVDAVRAGRMMVTTGPVIEASARHKGARAEIGEILTLGPNPRDVKLHVKVQAAPWIPVEEVRVLVNGNPFLTEDVSAVTATVRYDRTISIPILSDAFVIIEAGPPLPADPAIAPPPSGKGPGSATLAFSDVVPGAIAFAFTNPIFVDADGNGVFDAPGLEALSPSVPIAQSAVRLPADDSHEVSLDFLMKLRIPDEILATPR